MKLREAAVFLAVATQACASNHGAERLRARVAAQGPAQVISSLQEGEWQGLLSGVRRADPAYLDVAASLLPAAEQKPARRSLSIALQDALMRSPEAVLGRVPPRFACGLGTEGEGATSDEAARAIADRVGARVRSVSAPHLEDEKLSCLVALEAKIVLRKSGREPE